MGNVLQVGAIRYRRCAVFDAVGGGGGVGAYVGGVGCGRIGVVGQGLGTLPLRPPLLAQQLLF